MMQRGSLRQNPTQGGVTMLQPIIKTTPQNSATKVITALTLLSLFGLLILYIERCDSLLLPKSSEGHSVVDDIMTVRSGPCEVIFSHTTQFALSRLPTTCCATRIRPYELSIPARKPLCPALTVVAKPQNRALRLRPKPNMQQRNLMVCQLIWGSK